MSFDIIQKSSQCAIIVQNAQPRRLNLGTSKDQMLERIWKKIKQKIEMKIAFVAKIDYIA